MGAEISKPKATQAIRMWKAELRVKVAEGMPPARAVAALARENPQLHAEYLRESTEAYHKARARVK